MERVIHHSRRMLIGIIGGIIVGIGVILIPYPGPGWLIVFSGLAILSTEFAFAARMLEWLRGKYAAWVEWLKRQPRFVQLIVLAFTGLVVLVTVWLFNAFGFINAIFNLEQEWLVSPLLR